jgi:glycosyltransferase involved in cell wall biosynthesis
VSRYLHPLATTPDELTEHFAWADVMVLPARFEGVPLTILEAGRLGCVPLATDVGAVEEIIEHGKTGYLIDSRRDDARIVNDLRQCLGALCADRELLRRMSRQAQAYYGARSWQNSLRPLLDRLPLQARPSGRVRGAA